MSCPCQAPPVLIHFATCPHANRAQRLGTRPDFYDADGIFEGRRWADWQDESYDEREDEEA